MFISVSLGSTFRYHLTFCTVYGETPSIFLLALSSSPYCCVFCELVCFQRLSFVSVWFSVERSTEQFVYLIKINQILSSAAPSCNAGGTPKLSKPIPADMIPQGSDQLVVREEKESPARKTTKPQQVLGIRCHFERLRRCIGRMCRLRKVAACGSCG